MMKIRVNRPIKPISNAQFKADLRRGLQNVKQFLVGNQNSGAGIIKQEMDQPKTGRTYVISRRGRKILHTASSASGRESSAVLTGKLKGSIRGRIEGSDRLIVSANTPYARIQEKGGFNAKGAYIAPRNNLRRPILSNRGQIKNLIRNSIKNK